MAPVRFGEKWGWITTSGEWAIAPAFDESHFFEDGEPALFNSGRAKLRAGEKCGYIDPTGDRVIEAKFDEARSFEEGVARVRFGDKWGCIDPQGEWIIKPVSEVPPSRIGEFWAIKTTDCPILTSMPAVSRLLVAGSSRLSGNWDLELGVPYFAFDDEDCFERRLSPSGKALAELLCQETLELAEWADVSY